MSGNVRCSRCTRRLRGAGDGWNAIMQAGVIVGVVCPSCQAPTENAEAEINAATLDYSQDADGRIVGSSKASEQ